MYKRQGGSDSYLVSGTGWNKLQYSFAPIAGATYQLQFNGALTAYYANNLKIQVIQLNGAGDGDDVTRQENVWSDNNTSAQNTWQTVTYNYTADASDASSASGIAFRLFKTFGSGLKIDDFSVVRTSSVGTFSSAPAGLSINTSTGAIDLSASTAGTYTVQYITSTNQCADTATFDVTVTVCADNDGDGIPDNIDDDDDNDGISDVDEGTGDSDGDGIPDYLDLDSDNDGIYDVVEGGNGDQDTNGDGVIDSNDTGFADTDNDGMADGTDGTTPPDTDGDGIADYLDIDSDNDGIFDVVEGGDGASDTNNDGVVDSNDTGYADADGDGMSDNTESTTEPNTDGDNIPDYLDIDSDNDGIFDVVEGGDGASDTNGDGVIDSNDTGYADACLLYTSDAADDP